MPNEPTWPRGTPEDVTGGGVFGVSGVAKVAQTLGYPDNQEGNRDSIAKIVQDCNFSRGAKVHQGWQWVESEDHFC